jgi:hypothetical protein
MGLRGCLLEVGADPVLQLGCKLRKVGVQVVRWGLPLEPTLSWPRPDTPKLDKTLALQMQKEVPVVSLTGYQRHRQPGTT